MANFIFTKAAHNIAQGDIDWLADTIKVMLIKTGNSATTDRDSAEFVGDITTLNAYANADWTNAATLASKLITIDSGTNQSRWDAASTTFTSLAADAAATACLVFKNVTSAALSPLLCYIDTGGFPQNGTGSDYTIAWDATGVITFTAS